MGLVLLIVFTLSISYSFVPVSGLQSFIDESRLPKAVGTEVYSEYEHKTAPLLPELIGPQPQWDFLPNQKVEPVETIQNRLSDPNLVVNIDTDRRTYSPGDSINFVISVTSKFQPVSGSQVKVSFFEGENWWWFAPVYYEFEPPTLLESFVLTTDEGGQAMGRFGAVGEGFYSIRAEVVGNILQEVVCPDCIYARAYKTVQVSDIAVFWRVPHVWTVEEDVTSYVVVRKTENFTQPVSKAHINVTLFTGPWWEEQLSETLVYEGETDETGLIVAKFVVPEVVLTDDYYSTYGYAVLSVEKDSKTTQTTQWVSILPRSASKDYYYYGESWPGKYTFVVTTDKSVYQPGQLIRTRFLVFENSYYNASRRVASNLPVTVEFIDPEGFHLSHRQYKTKTDGILTNDFSLDKDASPGNYLIIYSAGGSETTIEVPVRFYQRPAFRVSLEAGRYYQPGQTIEGNISAEYYFGQPVHGSYEIHLYQLGEGYKTSEEVEVIAVPVPASGQEEVSEGYEIAQELATVVGELDKDGFGSFSLKIPREVDPYPGLMLQLNGTVTDVAERKVSASQTISVSPEIYIWAYAEPYTAELGEEVLIRFFVSDGWWWRRPFEESSVAFSNIDITVYSRQRDGDLGIQVFSDSTTADKFGQGDLSINLPQEVAAEYKNFIAVIEAETPDGRAGEGRVWFQYTVFDFDLAVSTKRIKPDDEVIVTLNLTNKLTGRPEQADVYVNAYDSDYDRIAEAQLSLDGKESLTIHLTSLAPEGTYQLYAWVANGYGPYYYGLYREYGWAEATFLVGELSELSISPYQTTYKVGQVASVKIETVTPSPESILPIYLEISKRGIVFFTVLDRSSFTLELPLTYSHTPKLFLNAFAIGASGAFLTATSEIQVDFDLTVNISTDKEIYAPREKATITITVEDGSGTRIPALTSLVLVDSSVYGVVPDSEREKDAFMEEDFYSTLTTRISWFSPRVMYPYWGIAEDVQFMRVGLEEEALAPAPLAPGTTVTEAKSMEFPEVQESEIRKVLPESAMWRPRIVIEPSGKLSLELELPDNIGECTIRTVTNVQGHGSLDKLTITTFKEFFVELKHPLFVYQDDTVEIQGLLYNYGNNSVAQATLRVEGEGLAYVVNAPTHIVPTFKGEITIVHWYVFASEPGVINATITAAAEDGRVDGLQKHLTIKPNAVLFEDRFAGVVNDTQLAYYLHAQSIQHSTRLTIVPGFTGAALEGWKRLIGYPYGCTEQTMSRLLPSAVVYQYLQETGKLDSDTQTQIEDMILAGISRLYAFHHPDGGWGWWEQDESNVHMTAIVLYGLGIISQLGFSIEAKVINSAIEYLLRQQRDGHWTMGGRGWEIGPTELTAYVVRAILIASSTSASDELRKNTQEYIENALVYLEDVWAATSSPYLGGLLGNALLITGTHQDLFEQIIAYLAGSYHLEGNMIYWGETEWWHWHALGGPVETTSIVLQLFLDSERTEYYLLVNRAATWLMSRQSRYGWGTTADTSAAILAITALAKLGGAEIDSTIQVTENEQLTHEFQFTSDSQAERVKLQSQVGLNTVEIEQEGTGVIFYHLEVSSHVRTELQPELPSHIEVVPYQEFPLTIELFLDETSPILPVDVQLQLEDWNESLELISDPIVQLDQVSSTTSVSFKLSPKETGTFFINRIRLLYSLASREELSNRAPATISRTLGPISITVQEQSAVLARVQQENSLPYQSNLSPKTHSGILKNTDEDTITISRTYSKSTGIQIGETVFVTIKITNQLKQPLSYLVVEEPLLPWFILDDYSLHSSEFSWSVTSDRLTFFIPSLESEHETKIEYGIIAIGNVDASAAATVVSSMYSPLKYRGTPSRLITTDIPQFNYVGKIPTLDTSPPTISDVQVSNARPKVSEPVRISVRVEDDQAVRTVMLWYKPELEDSWTKQVLTPFENSLYETEVRFNTEGTVLLYIQAEDWAQNSITTKEDSLIVEGRRFGFLPSVSAGLIIGVTLFAAGMIVFRVFYRRGARAISK